MDSPITTAEIVTKPIIAGQDASIDSKSKTTPASGKPTIEQIKERLLKSAQGEQGTETQATERKIGDEKMPAGLQELILRWADIQFKANVSGELTAEQANLLLNMLREKVSTATVKGIAGKDGEVGAMLAVQQFMDSDREIDEVKKQVILGRAEAFKLYNAQLGRVRLISSFDDQLALQIAQSCAKELVDFFSDNNPKHLDSVRQLSEFTQTARELYNKLYDRHSEDVHELRDRLRYLGLNKNLISEGENSQLITAIVKSAEFSRLTPEDRGKEKTGVDKNVLTTGENAEINTINTLMKNAKGETIHQVQDAQTLALVKNLTTDKNISSLKERFKDNPEALQIIDWIARQAIVRELLPREPRVPIRKIDMNGLVKIKELGKDEKSGKKNPQYQASNKVSLYVDPQTYRKFIVKECPPHTLQTDYFGLEVLQLFGVPIYEFYSGEVPQEEGQVSKPVLVTGFLEGFKDPSNFVPIKSVLTSSQAKLLQEKLGPRYGEVVDSPLTEQHAQILEEIKSGLDDTGKREIEGIYQRLKVTFPEGFSGTGQVQQAMLAEILIGEYNSKAHNFMMLGRSVQHLDQGGSLVCTASGKFKGFSDRLTTTDIQDVIHAYADWDSNELRPINEAYAQVAEVIDGKLVIKDVDMATRLLRQLKALPQDKLDEALIAAGYEDGPRSIAALQFRIKTIQEDQLPEYQKKADKELAEKGNVSERTKQYLRWSQSAIDTFQKAIEMGGELSYYRHALAQRRSDLENIWGQAITEGTMRNYLKKKWPDSENKFDRTIQEGTKVSSYLEGVLSGTDTETTNLRQALLEKLLDQQITNPEQYVSHGADHALEVAGLAGKLYDASPRLQQQLTKLFVNNAKTILQITSLIHDIGYPRLSPKENKSLHAVRGKEIFEGELASMLKSKFGLSDEQLTEIGFTIEHHPDDGLNSKNPAIPASDGDHALMFALRIGDLMDMSADRLSEIQRNPHFQKIVRRLFIEGQPGGRLYGLSTEDYEKSLTAIRQEELTSVKNELDPETFSRLDAIVRYLNDVSYPHFVGCMAVKEVNFSQNAEGGLMINVQKHGDVKEDLSVGDIPVVNYQVWRAQSALRLMRYNNRELQVAVK